MCDFALPFLSLLELFSPQTQQCLPFLCSLCPCTSLYHCLQPVCSLSNSHSLSLSLSLSCSSNFAAQNFPGKTTFSHTRNCISLAAAIRHRNAAFSSTVRRGKVSVSSFVKTPSSLAALALQTSNRRRFACFEPTRKAYRVASLALSSSP